MDHHIEPTRIAPGTCRSVLVAVMALTFGIVVWAIVGAAGTRPDPGSELASRVSPAQRESVVAASPALPAAIRCHDVALLRCAQVARSLVLWVNVTELDEGLEPAASAPGLDAWVIPSDRSN